ncbi:myotubularin-related 3-like isoform X1 [Paramuricea clavata]|uniref:phosphatidylinositol-3,5-bisphosphate 3-phosphatase n=2 Tax=Paramuricea clavata TaxID=317549 RepID=A0A7D9J9R0_PARCT|nr:myotubularin-related 3-like isoform X1 [Paramuricea clavata]
MNLANIHTIRKSFQSLRELCCKEEEQTDWLASLEATKWLSHISSLIKTALVVVKAVEQERQHVVVHCSDGWDRTPQVVALAELLLDPFYRTIKGFRVLLEREWLAFGHKFADRCGHSCQEYDPNERCPVFLQFLDCVHQLLRQFPCSFEFNETFLVKLVHHTYSCLYGTFLFNTEQERLAANITHRTCSVWSMLECQSRNCRNFLYSPREKKVLYPEYQVRNILLWSSLYLSTPLIFFGNSSSSNSSDTVLNTEEVFPNDCSRTEPETRPNLVRRNSDGDVKVSCNDENFVGCSGARDDSDLYLTKPLVCKSETSMSPSKGLLVNGLDRKSSEDIGSIYENNTFDRNGTECNNKMENGCENNSSDQNGILGEDYGGLNSCENTVVDQNGIPATDGGVNSCENTAFDQVQGEKSNDLGDSMTSSSNTIVEDSNSSNTDEVKVAGSEIQNGKLVSESGLEMSQTRLVSKAINCRSNHRLNHITDETMLLQDGLGASHTENHTTKVGNSFREFEETPKSPKELFVNKLGKCLDIDGLSFVVDPAQAQLVKIGVLVEQLQAQGCVCGIRQKVNMKQNMVANLEPTFEGSSSLSSNAASDTYGSWERVDGEDVTPVLWLPDHHAISCEGCDLKFSMTNRRHHCRNCGRVFCGSCCNDMTPVPSEQYYDPVRVCKTCFEKLHVKNSQDITVAAS